MNPDSSVLIEQPWLVIGICYVSLLTTLTVVVLVGSAVSSLLGTGRADTYGLFVRMLIGLVGSTVLYALIRTGFQTSLVPIVIFSIATCWVSMNTPGFTRERIKPLITKNQAIALLGGATITFVINDDSIHCYHCLGYTTTMASLSKTGRIDHFFCFLFPDSYIHETYIACNEELRQGDLFRYAFK